MEELIYDPWMNLGILHVWIIFFFEFMYSTGDFCFFVQFFSRTRKEAKYNKG